MEAGTGPGTPDGWRPEQGWNRAEGCGRVAADIGDFRNGGVVGRYGREASFPNPLQQSEHGGTPRRHLPSFSELFSWPDEWDLPRIKQGFIQSHNLLAAI
jgi:hypothetical protein